MSKPPEELAGLRVTVMGLGRFGGGIAVVNFLLAQGAHVTLTDLQDAESLLDSLQQIDTSKLSALILGGHRREDFEHADLIVANPAVNPARNSFLQAAINQNVPVTSEMELFWQRCPGRVIAVTGTVGKSTTASLIAHLLSAAGQRMHLGGNIGVSLLPKLQCISKDDWVVLELSSFQLALLAEFRPQPEIAVVTNLAPNHLDWHLDWDDYVAAKQNVSRWQRSNQLTVLNADDSHLRDWPGNGKRAWFGSRFNADQLGIAIQADHGQFCCEATHDEVPFSSLPSNLQSPHQRENIAAALVVANCVLHQPVDRTISTLKAFSTLPHRCEVVGACGGVTFINDSKATIPEATIAAVKSLRSPVILIAGGKDKKIDLSGMCQAIAGRIAGVALIGETADSLRTDFQKLRPELPSHVHSSLASAFDWCLGLAQDGDTVLLSPGCASYGEFRNYEDRGEQFRQLVRNYSETENFAD